MSSKDYFSLCSDEVHIWSACLSENEKNISYFTSLLSQDEQEKANCFKFFRDQQKYIVSRGILRSLLAGYLGTLQRIEIVYGLWGKPCLPKEKTLSFNLSHSGDYALYAFTQKYEIGVDVEYIDATLELEGVAQSIFSIEEFTYWGSLSPEEKLHSFFKYWVSKEAFLKASRKGWLENQRTPVFLENPMRVNNGLKPKQSSNLLENDKMIYPYCFESIPGYASALFIEGPFLRPFHFIWSPSVYQKTRQERV